ncbi:sensor histidine kinase [Mucilaginibacter sp.]|uniref:sensor histidine kinase n=1 Tax=Mucilaginibacter sp. TaxID=1882438 RepID=UPI002D00BCA0|nr:sensor histidine kinase [Mucilaginibacter sp.]HTI60780.1 sensor histidine kinase [Mucilaginibacter sp.]
MPVITVANLLYPRKPLRIALHAIFWALLFGIKWYLTLITFNVYGGFPTGIVALLNLLNTGLVAVCYYVLVYVIWQQVYSKRRYFKGGVMLAAMLILYTLADALTERLVLNTCPDCMILLKQRQAGYYSLVRSDIINIVLKRLLSLGTPFSLILTLFIPLCLKTTLNAYRSSVDSLKLAKENIQLEFNFLKAQLNPHFLFNTMNNIYGLIIKGDRDRSADLVSRLSGLLRYILYDSAGDSAPLAKEIKLLNDYIELEKVRLNFTGVVFNCHTDDADYEIAPLLLIPLVENAFKFSADEPGSFISIFLDVINGRLRFTIDNNIDAARTRSDPGGIGLNNLQKRLALHYPQKFWYETSEYEGAYSVNLTIQLT